MTQQNVSTIGWGSGLTIVFLEHASKRRRGIALLLAISMVLSLFAAPVSARANIGFDPFFFPGGPVFGPPIIIESWVEGGSRNVFLSLTNDTFRMINAPHVVHPDVTNLDNWVFVSSDDIGNVDFTLPRGGFGHEHYGLTLEHVYFVTARSVYLRIEGEVDFAFFNAPRRFYVIPLAAAMASRITPAPLIIYVGLTAPDARPLRPGQLSFTVEMPPAAGSPGFYQMDYIPFGRNPRDFLHVRLSLQEGENHHFDSATVTNLEYWRIGYRPICCTELSTTAVSAAYVASRIETEVGLYLERVERVRLPAWTAALPVYCPYNVLLVFTGSDIRGGPFPRDWACTCGTIAGALASASTALLSQATTSTLLADIHAEIGLVIAQFNAGDPLVFRIHDNPAIGAITLFLAAHDLALDVFAGGAATMTFTGGGRESVLAFNLNDVMESIDLSGFVRRNATNDPELVFSYALAAHLVRGFFGGIADAIYTTTLDAARQMAAAAADLLTQSRTDPAHLLYAIANEIDRAAAAYALNPNDPDADFRLHLLWVDLAAFLYNHNIELVEQFAVTEGGAKIIVDGSSYAININNVMAGIDTDAFLQNGVASVDTATLHGFVRSFFSGLATEVTAAVSGGRGGATGCTPSCCDDPDNLGCRSFTAEEIAHRVFIAALPGALRLYDDGTFLGRPTNALQVSMVDDAGLPVYGISINIPALPLSLEIANLPLGWLSAGPAGSHASATSIQPGQHPGQAIRVITVRATLNNPDAWFTTYASRVDNWHVALADASFVNYAGEHVRGLILQEVQVIPGTRVAYLSLVTTMEPIPHDQDFTSGWGPDGNNERPNMGTITNELIQNRDRNRVYTLAGTETRLDDDNWEYRIYIRALGQGTTPRVVYCDNENAYILVGGAIAVPSTVEPHRMVTGWHTHNVVADGSHNIGASFLVVGERRSQDVEIPIDGLSYMTARSTVPHPTDPTSWFNYTNFVRIPGYVQVGANQWVRNPEYIENIFSFDEGIFRGHQSPPLRQGWRIVYLTLMDGAYFPAGEEHQANLLHNWMLQTGEYVHGAWVAAPGSNFATTMASFVATGSTEATRFLHDGSYFRIGSVEVVRDGLAANAPSNVARVVLLEVSGDTPSAISDTEARPFRITTRVANNPGVRGAGATISATVHIDPFIPLTEIVARPTTNIAYAPLQGVDWHIPRNNAGVAGLHTVTIALDDDMFRDFAEFRYDADDGEFLAMLNWQVARSPVIPHGEEYCPEYYAESVITGWRNLVPGDSYLAYFGLRLLSVTLNPDNEAVLVFSGTTNNHSNSDITTNVDGLLHIRATSVPTAYVLYGGRALEIGHRHTRQATIRIGLAAPAPLEARYMTVISALSPFGFNDGFAPDDQNSPFDTYVGRGTGMLSPYVVLRTGEPEDRTHNVRVITVELEGTHFTAGATNPANWALAVYNFAGADSGFMLGTAANAHGMRVVGAVRVAGPDHQYQRVQLTIAGDATLHANHILQIRVANPAFDGASPGAIYALVRVGADLRPRLEVTTEGNATLTHIPALAVGQDYTVRVWIHNDAFTRYATIPANWSVRRNLCEAQVAEHQQHLPGRTGTFGVLADCTCAIAPMASAAVIVGITVETQDYIDNNPVNAFGFVDITVRGPLAAGSYLALSTAFDGTTTGNIPALVGGTNAFNRNDNTVPFPVEYLFIPVGLRIINPDVAVVDREIALVETAVPNAIIVNAPTATTEALAIAHVLGLIPASAFDLATVNTVSFVAPVTGTAANPMGTNGEFVFTVTVESNVGAGHARTTTQRTITVIAAQFTPIDFAALDTAIINATFARIGVLVLPGQTAENVANGVRFVTNPATLDDLNTAIVAAEVVRANATTQAEVTAHVTTLNSELAFFNGAIIVGTGTGDVVVDRGPLQAAITALSNAIDAATILDLPASQVPAGTHFWSTAVRDNAVTALQQAQTFDMPAATQAQVSAAMLAAQTALTNFNNARQTGTMQDGNGGEPLGIWVWRYEFSGLQEAELFSFRFNDGTYAIGLSYVGTGHGFEGSWFIFDLNGIEVWNLSVGTASTGTGWALCPVRQYEGLVYYIPGVGMAQGVHLTTHWEVYHTFSADYVSTPFAITENFRGWNVCQYSGDWFYMLAPNQLLRNETRLLWNIWLGDYGYLTADANGVLSW